MSPSSLFATIFAQAGRAASGGIFRCQVPEEKTDKAERGEKDGEIHGESGLEKNQALAAAGFSLVGVVSGRVILSMWLFSISSFTLSATLTMKVVSLTLAITP